MNDIRRDLSPAIVLGKADHSKLNELAIAGLDRMPDLADRLLGELDRARVVEDRKVPEDVAAWARASPYRTNDDKELSVILVYPADANIDEGKIFGDDPHRHRPDRAAQGPVHHLARPRQQAAYADGAGGGGTGFGGVGARPAPHRTSPVDLILSLSKDEVVAGIFGAPDLVVRQAHHEVFGPTPTPPTVRHPRA
jgi:hypothetical protein